MYIHFKFPPKDQENSKTQAVLPVIPTLYQSKRAKTITPTEEVQKMPDDVLSLDMNFSMFIPHKNRYKQVYTWPLKDSTVHLPLTVASSLKLAARLARNNTTSVDQNHRNQAIFAELNTVAGP